MTSTIEINFNQDHEEATYAAHRPLCRIQQVHHQHTTAQPKPDDLDDMLRQYYFSAEELRLLTILKKRYHINE
jgi:hypothetical protein